MTESCNGGVCLCAAHSHSLLTAPRSYVWWQRPKNMATVFFQFASTAEFISFLFLLWRKLITRCKMGVVERVSYAKMYRYTIMNTGNNNNNSNEPKIIRFVLLTIVNDEIAHRLFSNCFRMSFLFAAPVIAIAAFWLFSVFELSVWHTWKPMHTTNSNIACIHHSNFSPIAMPSSFCWPFFFCCCYFRCCCSYKLNEFNKIQMCIRIGTHVSKTHSTNGTNELLITCHLRCIFWGWPSSTDQIQPNESFTCVYNMCKCMHSLALHRRMYMVHTFIYVILNMRIPNRKTKNIATNI